MKLKKSLTNLKPLLLIALVFSVVFISCRQNSSQHYFNNGSAKYKLQNYTGAIKDLNQAIELKQDLVEAHYVKALCNCQLGKVEEAKNGFEKVLALDENFKDVYLNRAYYLKAKSGDYSGAIEDYNKFLEISDGENNAFAYNNRGFAKLKLNDIEGALSDIEKSIQLDPKNSFAYKNRGLVFVALDSTDLACEDFNDAIKLGYKENYDDEVNILILKYCSKQTKDF